jgi:glycosyltransferase involved in cell wall biosynthesis
MRIVVAGDTYPPDVNGCSIFTGNLATGLASRGHEVHLIAPSPSGQAYVEESRGVVVHRLASIRWPWHPTFRIARPVRARRDASQIIHDAKPDVVHVQSHFVIARCAAAAARRQRVPWVATNHFMPENIATQLPFPVPRTVFRISADLAWRDVARIYRHASVITSPTQTAADLLHRRAGIAGALPISCGVDTSAFVPAQVAETDAPSILFVGRLEHEKHVDEIIDALPLIDRSVTLRIVGEGSQEGAWRRRVSELGLGHRVEFLGHVDDAGLRAEYERAQLFCMPGTVELQSIATLEAMAAGLPVVAADALALPHLVHPGINGDLYRPGDVRGLAAAIENTLADEASRQVLAKASRGIAEDHDIELTLDAMEKAYADASVLVR